LNLKKIEDIQRVEYNIKLTWLSKKGCLVSRDVEVLNKVFDNESII